MLCYNLAQDVKDYWMGDPLMTNPDWNYVAYGSNQRISKYYKDLLVNMRGSGVEDPRMTKIVPAVMSSIKLDASGKVASFNWLRSEGVDSYGAATRLLEEELPPSPLLLIPPATRPSSMPLKTPANGPPSSLRWAGSRIPWTETR